MCVYYGIPNILYITNERILKGKQMTTMEHVISADARVCSAIIAALYTRNTHRYNRPLHEYKLYIPKYICPIHLYVYLRYILRYLYRYQTYNIQLYSLFIYYTVIGGDMCGTLSTIPLVL